MKWQSARYPLQQISPPSHYLWYSAPSKENRKKLISLQCLTRSDTRIPKSRTNGQGQRYDKFIQHLDISSMTITTSKRRKKVLWMDGLMDRRMDKQTKSPTEKVTELPACNQKSVQISSAYLFFSELPFFVLHLLSQVT